MTILRRVVGTSVSYLTYREHGAREETMSVCWLLTELNLQLGYLYTRKQINGTEGQVKVLS